TFNPGQEGCGGAVWSTRETPRRGKPPSSTSRVLHNVAWIFGAFFIAATNLANSGSFPLHDHFRHIGDLWSFTFAACPVSDCALLMSPLNNDVYTCTTRPTRFFVVMLKRDKVESKQQAVFLFTPINIYICVTRPLPISIPI
ncbi:unnamed protein product, partial [Ectocarpus sp. 8 AP-2014]